jgi:hypothetical protein
MRYYLGKENPKYKQRFEDVLTPARLSLKVS